MSDTTPTTPPGPDPPLTSPAIGRDEWVARHLERRLPPRLGLIERRIRAVPWWAWLVLFVGAACMLPVFADSGYVRRAYGFDIVLYMLLALGLNVVVGWGGLLDLGYVAFYGVGAYAYALLDSPHYGIHMWAVLSIPLVVVIGAVVGLLLGLPSRRLSGDYLAIVTLFFLQLFQTLATNGDQFLFGAGNVTGGANGLLNVDPIDFFGKEIAVQHNGVFAVGYYFIALGVFALVFVALRFVNESRTGRAWRSQREDPLAAEVMGMPVNWLKLMSFAFGAAVAALTGTLFASLNASVFPLSFYFVTLITVYTMVILGGQGSQWGVVLGAILISVLLELLRDTGNARGVFYVILAAGLVVAFKLSRRLPIIAAAVIGFGFAAHAIADAVDHSWVAGTSKTWTSDWVIIPEHLASWVPAVTYVGLIASVLALTLLRGWVRAVALVPILYLAAFVWENVMLAKPEPTRYIVIGVILISLMVLRPNGLLGEKRVEIV
ncbi:MAG TPA: branched-chain amino acid ABC transporter permease [Gaiellaceae bacterium]|nr:branched-chain amino acid ABC transporter permease [Gaiellaceae bacterium]